ncbi:chaperone NapD [Pseudomonas sp. PDM16]|uniref:chaperone NapD n=1 Tax=Pseudomonas sp. PDM16 TaxID=2769292 RepID=UPI001784A462|nr:chaperone NapD [Pseudomonas sp. PDM16]MBD9414361.1 chaperone NapD [Pseudomonas sp. PDM16]
MDETLHIASLVVHCHPEQLDAVRANLARLPDLELHQSSDAGKQVVVLEARDEGAILERLHTIQQLPGVLGAALIYHELLDASGEAR